MIELKNEKLHIKIDESTGYTVGIYGNDGNNWVREDSDFGHIEGIEMTDFVVRDGNTVRITYSSESSELPVHAVVEKTLCDGEYTEKYTVINDDRIDFFFREGVFGIHMPFENVIRVGEPWFTKLVNAHLWCGNGITWIQAKRFSGNAPYLYVYMTEGDVCGYDISRNADLAEIGLNYRGDLVLNPKPRGILPGKSITTAFSFRLDEREPREYFSSFEGHIELDAIPYTSVGGEPITMTARYSGKIISAEICCDDEKLPFSISGSEIVWRLEPKEYREYTCHVRINGKHTWIRVNALPDMKELLLARARFIRCKQQYFSEGSHLDGAYLIYESNDDSLYYSHFFHDHNASRERIAMGLTVIQALRICHDDELEASLRKYISFLERELVDTNTGEVFESEMRDNRCIRIYNYPWFACFYLDLYALWGRKNDLIVATKIVRRYYEQNGIEQDSQCMPMTELVKTLECIGETSLAEEMKGYFTAHADAILNRNMMTPSGEGACAPESAATVAIYFAQAYILTGEKKYIDALPAAQSFAESFFAFQPDVHMHGMGLRHWDGYWFGSYMQYGDLFPHQWNCLAGEMYHYIALADDKKTYETVKKDILLNNLTGFQANGFAPSSYLYPHKITVYSNDPAHSNKNIPVGVGYGRRYDTWSNDQDWALYYAAKRLIADP